MIAIVIVGIKEEEVSLFAMGCLCCCGMKKAGEEFVVEVKSDRTPPLAGQRHIRRGKRDVWWGLFSRVTGALATRNLTADLGAALYF